MDIFRIEENRLKLADEVRGQFVIAHDEFGDGIAYSADTLILFHDEKGTKTFAITPESFKWLGDQFFVLKGFLFHGMFKLGKIAPGSIRGRAKNFIWDDKTVFYLNGPVKGADPATFEVLGDYWSRDALQVFYQHRLIQDADRASFRIFDSIFAVDARHIYGFAGLIVAKYQADPISLGTGYYEISGKVHHYGEEVKGADLKSFKTLPVIRSEEKTRILANGGPKNPDESLATAGFHAYDNHRKYKGTWSTSLK